MTTFNKILKEIIYILSYVNESGILDIKDVEKYLKNGINKTNFLLIDLLLEQKTTQKKDDLYNGINEEEEQNERERMSIISELESSFL